MPTIPEWQIDQGGAKLLTPSEYYTQAKELSEKFSHQGIIGFLVKNRFNELKPMTFRVFTRMIDKFEGANPDLKIVDYWKWHQAPTGAGMQGFDTEFRGVFS